MCTGWRRRRPGRDRTGGARGYSGRVVHVERRGRGRRRRKSGEVKTSKARGNEGKREDDDITTDHLCASWEAEPWRRHGTHTRARARRLSLARPFRSRPRTTSSFFTTLDAFSPHALLLPPPRRSCLRSRPPDYIRPPTARVLRPALAPPRRATRIMSTTSAAAAAASTSAAALKAPANLKVRPHRTPRGCLRGLTAHAGRRDHPRHLLRRAHRHELRLQEEGAPPLPGRPRCRRGRRVPQVGASRCSLSARAQAAGRLRPVSGGDGSPALRLAVPAFVLALGPRKLTRYVLSAVMVARHDQCVHSPLFRLAAYLERPQ
jgi:hypothetical protein